MDFEGNEGSNELLVISNSEVPKWPVWILRWCGLKDSGDAPTACSIFRWHYERKILHLQIENWGQQLKFRDNNYE